MMWRNLTADLQDLFADAQTPIVEQCYAAHSGRAAHARKLKRERNAMPAQRKAETKYRASEHGKIVRRAIEKRRRDNGCQKTEAYRKLHREAQRRYAARKRAHDHQ